MGPMFGGSAQRVMQILASVVLVVAALYFGREMLIPLSMAVLLTFLLSPLVTWLERRRLPRPLAVVLVMMAIGLVTGGAAWIIGRQVAQMAKELPEYKQNLRERIANLRFNGGALNEVQKTIDQVNETVQTQQSQIQEVRVVPDEAVPFDTLTVYTSTVLTPLANLAIIFVLVLFMLINREDVRNRIVRLSGKRLTLTTRTLDEIGTRISRYLLASALINGSFGLAVAAGLSLIGVDYALLWGFLAGLLRFVPYAGPALGALMPITMAFIQFPASDWQHLALTMLLFLLLELITNNVIEPLMYGQSAGVSTVALLVSVTFWTWVWGPMGLVLAVPLTVVMAVLGEHVPALEPLGILLGDKPPLASHMAFYQRLLAHDVEEAVSVFEDQCKSDGLPAAFDQVLIPALVLAEKDHDQGELDAEERDTIWQVTRELIEDSAAADESASPMEAGLALVLCCPAHDEADELSLAMLDQVVPAETGRLKLISKSILASEIVDQVQTEPPHAVFISSLGPIGVRQTHYLCKRLRQAKADLRIIVGRWGYRGDRQRMVQSLKRRGADHVVTTLAEARDLLSRLQSTASWYGQPTPAPEAEAAASVQD